MLDDVVDGYVSVEAARSEYGVEVTYRGDPDAWVRPPESYEARELPRRAAGEPSAASRPTG